MTNPVSNIIPREIPEDIKPIINWFTQTLEEVVNYGSHILLWDCDPKTKGEENVAPTMLFRHFLDIIDSISILVREGTGDTSKILARAALELMLYIEYLFEKDTVNRAMAFIVEDTHRQIKSIGKLNPNTHEGKEMYQTFKNESLLADFNVKSTSQIDDFINSKRSMLKLPQFKEAQKEYERLRKQGEGNAKWYRYFNGPKNIEALAKHLQQKTLYEILYRKWSGSVHGTDIYLGRLDKTDDENRVDIVQIRFIKDLQNVVSFSLTLALKVFKVYVTNRIPEKKKEFVDWYSTIRNSVMKISENQYIKVE